MDIAETLQALYDLPADLPPLGVTSRRRAGHNLDGEWTRSVWFCSVLHRCCTSCYECFKQLLVFVGVGGVAFYLLIVSQ